MRGAPVLPLVLLGVAVSVSPACKSKTQDVADAAPAPVASAPVPSPSASASALAAATCVTDQDCQPMNCCFALKPESCQPRARTKCDEFNVSCEPYTGPHYACACVTGACTGNPAGPREVDAGSAMAPWGSRDLKPQAVLDGIIKHGPDVRACQARAKKASGQISMIWTILPTGKVEKPQVLLSSVGSPPLATCLTKKVGAWKFPKARGQTRVTYDFRFGR